METQTLSEKASQRDIIRFDYEQAHEAIRTLSDIRFKLLTLVPFVSGATITFLSLHPADVPRSVVLAGSFAGFLVTVGILIYDYRNTQIIEVTRVRCVELEKLLKLPIKGQFQSFQHPSLLRAEWGLVLIYSTVLAAWVFLIVHALDSLPESSGTNTLLTPLVRWATLSRAAWGSGAAFVLLFVLMVLLIIYSRAIAKRVVGVVEEGECEHRTGETTMTQDVTIFEGDQGPDYVRWIESHPSGTVLVVKSTYYGTIHDADCWHIGAPTEPRASVGRTKVCGKVGEVKKWARDQDIKTDWCQTCQG